MCLVVGRQNRCQRPTPGRSRPLASLLTARKVSSPRKLPEPDDGLTSVLVIESHAALLLASFPVVNVRFKASFLR